MHAERFTTLKVEERAAADGNPAWQLLEPLSYTAADGTVYTAPTGLITDFASVPFFVQWVVPRTGHHNKAAVIHDALWRLANDGDGDRQLADEVFRDASGDLGVSWLRRWMMWTAVRQGGLFTARRGSWPFRDILRVAGISVLLAPIVIPTSTAVVGARIILWAIDAVPTLVRDGHLPRIDEAF